MRGSQSDGHVIVDVIDTGSGIPEGVDIFELFTTAKPNGIGLGLAVVRQIVLAHGWTITYTSEPGQGTVFRVSLPRSKEKTDENKTRGRR